MFEAAWTITPGGDRATVSVPLLGVHPHGHTVVVKLCKCGTVLLCTAADPSDSEAGITGMLSGGASSWLQKAIGMVVLQSYIPHFATTEAGRSGQTVRSRKQFPHAYRSASRDVQRHRWTGKGQNGCGHPVLDMRFNDSLSIT